MRLFAIATLALIAVLANSGGLAPHPSEAAWPGANGLLTAQGHTGTSTANIPISTLLEGPGPGAFNAPYTWHMDPAQVTLTDVAAEACDALPSYVEDNPSQFFLLGYCPWSAELVELADFR